MFGFYRISSKAYSYLLNINVTKINKIKIKNKRVPQHFKVRYPILKNTTPEHLQRSYPVNEKKEPENSC